MDEPLVFQQSYLRPAARRGDWGYWIYAVVINLLDVDLLCFSRSTLLLIILYDSGDWQTFDGRARSTPLASWTREGNAVCKDVFFISLSSVLLNFPLSEPTATVAEEITRGQFPGGCNHVENFLGSFAMFNGCRPFTQAEMAEMLLLVGLKMIE